MFPYTACKELADVLTNRKTLLKGRCCLSFIMDGNKMTLFEIGELHNVSGESIRRIEGTALTKLRRSPWGHKKSIELYGQKKQLTARSIPGTNETINFAQSICVMR